MNTFRFYCSVLCATVCVLSASAQYCNTTKGTVFTYQEYDAETNATSYSHSQIAVVQKQGDATVVCQKFEEKEGMFDKNDTVSQVLFSFENPQLTRAFLLTGNEVKKKFAALMSSSYDKLKEEQKQKITKREYEAKINEAIPITGDLMIPLNANASAGQAFPNSKLQIKVKIMKMTIGIQNGKYLGFETIATQAGQYKCLKISYTLKMSAMMMSESQNITDWYAPGVGLVKSEARDGKGKITSSRILTAISIPSK